MRIPSSVRIPCCEPWICIIPNTVSPLLPPTSPPPSACPVVSAPTVTAANAATVRDVGSVSSTSRVSTFFALRVLHVHDRRRAADGDGFLHVAHLQVGADVGREAGGQLDAFTLDGAETWQRERHGVGAGAQFRDRVPTVRVGDDGANLLDQRRAGGFHRDAGKHGSRACP